MFFKISNYYVVSLSIIFLSRILPKLKTMTDAEIFLVSSPNVTRDAFAHKFLGAMFI